MAEGGLDVTLVDPWKDHVDRIRANGLQMTGFGGDRFIPVRAVTSAEAAFGRELAAGVVDQAGSEIDRLKVMRETTEADCPEWREIIAATDDSGPGQAKNGKVVANTIGHKVASFGQKFQA